VPRERTAYKELRKSKRRHARNISIKTELKTLKKNYERLLTDKKIDEAKKLLPKLSSKIAKAAGKGIVNKNTAARQISRLSKRLSTAAKA